MKRLLQLLLTGEAEPLALPEHRYYLGLDLGMQGISVAVVGHVEEGLFRVDHYRQWKDWHFPAHEREIAALLDAYTVNRGWVDHYNSSAIVNRFSCIAKVRATRHTVQGMERIIHYILSNGLMDQNSPPIPGKPSDYFTVLIESLRHTLEGESANKDDDVDSYIMALTLALWGAATFENDWIGSRTLATI